MGDLVAETSLGIQEQRPVGKVEAESCWGESWWGTGVLGSAVLGSAVLGCGGDALNN